MVIYLFLFVYPLKKLIANQADEIKQDVISMVKINIINTTMCMVSSVTLFVIMGESGNIHELQDYLWFGGGVDIIINSLATFTMLNMNRKYVKDSLCRCGCRFICTSGNGKRDANQLKKHTKVHVGTNMKNQESSESTMEAINKSIQDPISPCSPDTIDMMKRDRNKNKDKNKIGFPVVTPKLRLEIKSATETEDDRDPERTITMLSNTSIAIPNTPGSIGNM